MITGFRENKSTFDSPDRWRQHTPSQPVSDARPGPLRLRRPRKRFPAVKSLRELFDPAASEKEFLSVECRVRIELLASAWKVPAGPAGENHVLVRHAARTYLEGYQDLWQPTKAQNVRAPQRHTDSRAGPSC